MTIAAAKSAETPGEDKDVVEVVFFHAEDCIRSGHVTGVQTCALPIYERDPSTERVVGDRVHAKGGRGPYTYRCGVLLEDREIDPEQAAIGDQEQIVPCLHGLAIDDHFLRDFPAARS